MLNYRHIHFSLIFHAAITNGREEMASGQCWCLNSTLPHHRNSGTMGKGETGKIKAGQKTVAVKCLEVKEHSVVMQIEGIEQPKEIGFKPAMR